MNWTDEYSEIVEFYYWEPQHIGRAKGERRFTGAVEMLDHINNIEVSLNHILSLFFSLYDVNRLAESIPMPAGLKFVSSKQLSVWQNEMKDYTQPDLYFQGDDANLAIELKLGAKIDCEQIAKYIIFNHHVSEKPKPLSLIVLSPTADIESISKEKFKSLLDVRSALLDYIPSKKSLLFCSYEQYLKELGQFKINTLSLSELVSALLKNTHENDIEMKLVNGLIAYLSGRSLVDPIDPN